VKVGKVVQHFIVDAVLAWNIPFWFDMEIYSRPFDGLHAALPCILKIFPIKEKSIT
jgi:hypothetical protein